MNKIRLYENLHIVLWLMKDSCWLLHLKILGTIMVFPTLAMAIYISWRTIGNRRLFIPNLAVCFWISANITWMLGEFYHYNFKLPAGLLFGSGLIAIAFYFKDLLPSKKVKKG